MLFVDYVYGIVKSATEGFDGSSFGYEQKRDLEEDNVYSMPFDDSEYGYLTSGFTIVGNIHDNPELMKTE